jgi:3-dehydrosphinganine reductase
MAKPALIKRQPFNQKIVVICGGSKGIGKETAKEIARLGGSLCLVARGEEALRETVEEVKALFVSPDQFIDWIVCDATDYDVLAPLLTDFVEQRGTPDYLINVVGYAYPEYILNLTLDDFKQNMDVNYYGQIVPTQILLPHFIEAGKGHISFVSSMLGFMGIIGYATYAPSKYALVGIAEVLRHEIKPLGIDVSILYPPDTDTPGFEIENQTKPPETAMLSETAKLFTAEDVASAYIGGLLKKKFHIVIGEGRWIWPLSRYFPRLVHLIIDSDLIKARKKMGKL